MTSKELEHYLIENDWRWEKEDKTWRYKNYIYPAISDEYVRDEPDKVLEFINYQMERRK